MKKVHLGVIIAGAAVGLAALILTALGNPANMGFCIACFLRDISGAVGLHSAAKVQYVRPEIIGLVLGAFIMSVASKEFKARAGSSPAIRFVLGAFVVIGALAFLGCPLRMVLRLGGGDLNALVGLIGFTGGILLGIASLKKGFSLKRSYEAHKAEGGVLPTVMAALLILVVTVPALFKFSEEGPGSMRAPFWIALVIALVVGALAQKSRLCMVGGLRDAFMLKDFHLLYGFVATSSSRWSATSPWASSTSASRSSPSRTARTCGICWAWCSSAGAACCSAAARCASSFWPRRATATVPSPCSVCSSARRSRTTSALRAIPTPRARRAS